MDWIDITLPLREDYPCWPGDVPFRRKVNAVIGEKDAEFNISSICTSLHFGTHVDAPYHYRMDGKKVDELDLDLLIGPCRVVEIEREDGSIGIEDLKGKVPPGTLRLLVKSSNSRRIHDRCFHSDYIAFSPESIRWLLELGVRLLGLDYYSIGPFSGEGGVVHRLFFQKNDSVALEAVDLSKVEPGEYHLVCLPMKVYGADGAPARVLLGSLTSRRT